MIICWFFGLRKKGSKTKKRMKEEEIEKGDWRPPTRKVFFLRFWRTWKKIDIFDTKVSKSTTYWFQAVQCWALLTSWEEGKGRKKMVTNEGSKKNCPKKKFSRLECRKPALSLSNHRVLLWDLYRRIIRLKSQNTCRNIEVGRRQEW